MIDGSVLCLRGHGVCFVAAWSGIGSKAGLQVFKEQTQHQPNVRTIRHGGSEGEGATTCISGGNTISDGNSANSIPGGNSISGGTGGRATVEGAAPPGEGVVSIGTPGWQQSLLCKQQVWHVYKLCKLA